MTLWHEIGFSVGATGMLGEANTRLLGGKMPKLTFVHFTPRRQRPPISCL
jgi:hypothetical protein